MSLPSYVMRHWFLQKACGVRIGRGSSIHMGCFITGRNITIGENTVINRGVYLDGRAGVVIGNRVNISHKVLIQSLSHDPQCPHFNCVVKPVHIGNYAWLGARALILPGVHIGEGAIVGAGAVVAKDVAPYAIVAGNPARPIGTRKKNLTYVPCYFPLFDTDIQ